VSEVANVFELGFRGQASSSLTYSATLFWHEWENLRSGSAPLVRLENKIQGAAYGVEAWGSWQASRNWRLSSGFMTLRKRLELEPGSTDPQGVTNPNLSNDAELQWMLRSSLDLAPNHQFDATVRRVGKLPNPVVTEYIATDLRYGWRAHRDLELSLTVRNAFDPEHVEFNAAPERSEIERSFFIAAKLTY
jgi:iron complex outermembrane receptor protein